MRDKGSLLEVSEGSQWLSARTPVSPRRRGSVMFSDIIVEHGDEINVCINEKNTQTEDTLPQHTNTSRKPSLKCKTATRVILFIIQVKYPVFR